MKLGKKFFILLYSFTIVFFILYILFISDNNLEKHRELNRKEENLDKSILEVQSQVSNKNSYSEIKENPELLEQYAREQENMKKEDEDMFIISSSDNEKTNVKTAL